MVLYVLGEALGVSGATSCSLPRPPVLRAHGVVVACSYGQTELSGPVMFGMPDGDPNALRPFKGVSYELVRGEEDGEDEGELCLLGNESSTDGCALPELAILGRSVPAGQRVLDRWVRLAQHRPS